MQWLMCLLIIFAKIEGHIEGFLQIYLSYFLVLQWWLLMKRKREKEEEEEEEGKKGEKERRKEILNFYSWTKMWKLNDFYAKYKSVLQWYTYWVIFKGKTLSEPQLL